jgi:GR25 family glycosyltransferase involved in LPS biosynthesis
MGAVLVLHVAARVNISTDLKASFYINLEDMPSRRAHMEYHLETAGLSARRIAAVDWRRVVVGEFDREYVIPQGIHEALRQKPVKEGNGTIGCFVSHIAALERASKEIAPDEVALVLEDDVSIPEDWRFRLQRTVDQAPPDWELLKVAGWGDARATDLVNRSATPDSTQTLVQTRSRWSNFSSAIRSMFSDEDADVKFFHVHWPFKEPARFNWGTLGWGSPNYFYAGTSAYLVRGKSIGKIIHHLRSQPLNDIDAMLLSNGSMRFYEGWPHVFGFASDSWLGPRLHATLEGFDELDSDGRAAEDQIASTQAYKEGFESRHHLRPLPDDVQGLVIDSRDQTVVRQRQTFQQNSEVFNTDFDHANDKKGFLRTQSEQTSNAHANAVLADQHPEPAGSTASKPVEAGASAGWQFPDAEGLVAVLPGMTTCHVLLVIGSLMLLWLGIRAWFYWLGHDDVDKSERTRLLDISFSARAG